MTTETMDVGEIAELVGDCLNGTSGADLGSAGFGVQTLDIGEVYLRAPDGTTYRMTVSEVPAEDVEGWGISFDA